MKCRLLCGALALLLGTSLSAQQIAPVHKAVEPKFAGTYLPGTGEFKPGVATERAGPVVIFNNMVASNYYSVPGANQEWIDDGVLNDRNACDTEQINCFDFIYCSTDPAPTGTITITFYDENVECAGPVNLTPLCAYAISGLPMGTATGGIQCWIVSVDLDTGDVQCPNTLATDFRTTGAHPANPLFGWGILPGLNNTGPWLRRGGKGIVNDFTWFDRSVSPPIFVGCFWFGGTPFANFAIKLLGPDAPCRSYISRNGKGPLDTVKLKSGPVTKGGAVETWMVTNPVAGQSYVLIASQNPDDTGILGNQATRLVKPPFLPPSPVPMPGGTLTGQVPGTYPFPRLYVQAVCHIAGNIQGMSNALCYCFAP
ncbi:MAG: hypothetical protein EYC70_02205 [Planctomycetota bacterium]|nr:MAG: hypothetical protein EYC70_02205 [Planctomycetota bacterium]